MGLFEGHDGARRQRPRSGWKQAKREFRARSGRRHDEPLRLFQIGKRRTRAGGENLARGGQNQPPPRAIEQGGAKQLLKLADRLGGGGLADMQRLGRCRKRPAPGGLEKHAQMAQPEKGIEQFITLKLSQTTNNIISTRCPPAYT